MNEFLPSRTAIDGDIALWNAIIMKQLEQHAPIKSKKVNCKRLFDWFSPENTQVRRLRDINKRM